MNARKIIYDKNDEVSGIAVYDDSGLMEIDIFDAKRALEGNVFLARIDKKIKLANDKTAFMVNIGDGTEAFLNSYEPTLKEANMSEGQSVVVQVAQEKHAEKGAKVVRNIQIAGAYVVYCPFKYDVDVSNKINDSETADKLRKIVKENSKLNEGWVVRTMAVEAEEHQIIEEMNNLREIYENIRKKARSASAPALLYTKENPLFEYIRRYKDSLQQVVVDSPNLAKEVSEIFSGDVVIQKEGFEAYGVDDEIVNALNKSVKLKNGGSLLIEETRACVAIDVDSSGVSAGGAIDNLNVEAAKEIARQIRLRNLSGKIVIDFAGSSEYRFMKRVIEVLEEELADDACHSRILGLSRAGNIEIMRQRRRPTLRDLYTVECPTCQGSGRVEP